jgi:hypothetical protein
LKWKTERILTRGKCHRGKCHPSFGKVLEKAVKPVPKNSFLEVFNAC